MNGSPLPARQVTADAAVRGLLARVTRLGVTCTSGPASHNAGQPIRELVHGELEFGALSRRLAGGSGPDVWVSPGLAAARFLFLLTGRPDLRLIMPFSAGVRRFAADGTRLGGSAYGARLFGIGPGDDQLRRCAEIIASRPNTKRAAAVLFDPYAGNENGADVACCLGIVFAPRSGTLDASVIMRANDALRLLPYNVFEFSMLTELTARLTGLQAGTYRHMAVSMHLRGEHDIELASALCAAPAAHSPADMGAMPEATWDTVAALARLGSELPAALSSQPPDPGTVLRIVTHAESLGPYWQDLIAAAAARGLAQPGAAPGSGKLPGEHGLTGGPLLGAELAYQRQRLKARAISRRGRDPSTANVPCNQPCSPSEESFQSPCPGR
jgi:hypothetical protein